MRQQDKKKAVLLAALLGILAVYWTYHLFFQGTRAAKAPAPAAQKRSAAAPAVMTKIKVDLDLLQKKRPAYTAVRNIFSPVYVKPVLVKPSQQPKGPQTVTVTPLPPLPPPPPPKSPEQIAADNAREDIRKLKVLGFLKRKGKTNVFLSLGGESYTVPEGGNITKDYYLTELGPDYIVVTDKATGVTEKLKTQLATKPMAMPGGGPAAATQSGPSPWPPPPQGGSAPGMRGMPGGASRPVYPGGGPGGGTTSVTGVGIVPPPSGLGGNSIR
jgi:hypothetical protein